MKKFLLSKYLEQYLTFLPSLGDDVFLLFPSTGGKPSFFCYPSDSSGSVSKTDSQWKSEYFLAQSEDVFVPSIGQLM